jgi:hypothetical protein
MSDRGGPTDRSVGLLVGRARLSGMAETLVGGDPGVPMSLTLSFYPPPLPRGPQLYVRSSGGA